ncbi:MAG: helix-turn-helix domain-containing protein [Dehalococcoidia bacterium]|nr:helix-turn-helix domain-containing protein [Dehalococcoidia bacterium]
MGDGVILSKREEQRGIVLGQVGIGILSIAEAAALIGVSERQVRRLLTAYQRDGPRGIVHGNRGRSPAHATSGEIREKVLALATGRYAGVNHSHLAELLGESEGLHLSRATVQRILAKRGVRSPKPQRRRSTHRSRRKRYPQEGPPTVVLRLRGGTDRVREARNFGEQRRLLALSGTDCPRRFKCPFLFSAFSAGDRVDPLPPHRFVGEAERFGRDRVGTQQLDPGSEATGRRARRREGNRRGADVLFEALLLVIDPLLLEIEPGVVRVGEWLEPLHERYAVQPGQHLHIEFDTGERGDISRVRRLRAGDFRPRDDRGLHALRTAPTRLGWDGVHAHPVPGRELDRVTVEQFERCFLGRPRHARAGQGLLAPDERRLAVDPFDRKFRLEQPHLVKVLVVRRLLLVIDEEEGDVASVLAVDAGAPDEHVREIGDRSDRVNQPVLDDELEAVADLLALPPAGGLAFLVELFFVGDLPVLAPGCDHAHAFGAWRQREREPERRRQQHPRGDALLRLVIPGLLFAAGAFGAVVALAVCAHGVSRREHAERVPVPDPLVSGDALILSPDRTQEVAHD